MDSKALTSTDIARGAIALGVEPAHIRAVSAVESRGSGFQSDGKPVILFERHKMYQALVAKFGANQADAWASKMPDVVNPKAGGYGPESQQHERLARAAQVDRPSALESASWGRFQVMGYHWRALGYGSLQDFINRMYQSEGDHLDAFVRYVQLDARMVRALQSADWANFARLFNGPAYAANAYDTKLAMAFKKARNAEVPV